VINTGTPFKNYAAERAGVYSTGASRVMSSQTTDRMIKLRVGSVPEEVMPLRFTSVVSLSYRMEQVHGGKPKQSTKGKQPGTIPG
jgi:hypothetical protein